MTDKKILYVSSEVVPYLPENEISSMSYDVPKIVNDLGGDIRIFMPRYGTINERRHQLHEVIRLSGMNLVVNDQDMPLIIKVASIPKERIQVYFTYNEEYFKRKSTFANDKGVLHPDNDERAIFFAKGVVETVKKLNWSPDIIHVHGWLASLLPIYLKNYYKDEALFSETKIVTSLYSCGFEGNLDVNLIDKLEMDGILRESVSEIEKPSYINLLKASVKYSDGIILGSETVCQELVDYVEKLKKPCLKFVSPEDLADSYVNFYKEDILK